MFLLIQFRFRLQVHLNINIATTIVSTTVSHSPTKAAQPKGWDSNKVAGLAKFLRRWQLFCNRIRKVTSLIFLNDPRLNLSFGGTPGMLDSRVVLPRTWTPRRRAPDIDIRESTSTQWILCGCKRKRSERRVEKIFFQVLGWIYPPEKTRQTYPSKWEVGQIIGLKSAALKRGICHLSNEKKGPWLFRVYVWS